MRPTKHSRYFIEAIDRGLAILRLFDVDNPTLTLADITRRSNNVPSTALRLVQTLVDLDFLEPLPDVGRYQPSLAAMQLGYKALESAPLRKLALPILGRLRNETNHTVWLATLIGPSIFVLETIAGTRHLPVDFRPGHTFPAYGAAAGKAIFAAMQPESRWRALMPNKMDKLGPNTIGSQRELAVELEKVRRVGFAIEDEELFAGICSVGAAVGAGSNRIDAALAISVPRPHIEIVEVQQQLAPAIVGAAAELRMRLNNVL